MLLEWHGSDGVEALLYSDPVSESGEAGEAGMMPGCQLTDPSGWTLSGTHFCVHLNTSHGHFLFAVLK